MDGFLASVGGILRVLCGKLLLPFVLLASYCAGVVIAAQALGLWHTTAIKETVYWFLGTGVLLVGRAIESASIPNWARTILRPALRLTLIAEFLVNLYLFPFGVEMALVPFVVVVVLVEAIAVLDPAHAPAQRFSSGVITTIGFGLLAYVLVSVFSDLSGFLARANAEAYLLAPALTLASFPILLIVVRWVRWDTAAVRRRWQAGIGSVWERHPASASRGGRSRPRAAEERAAYPGPGRSAYPRAARLRPAVGLRTTKFRPLFRTVRKRAIRLAPLCADPSCATAILGVCGHSSRRSPLPADAARGTREHRPGRRSSGRPLQPKPPRAAIRSARTTAPAPVERRRRVVSLSGRPLPAGRARELAPRVLGQRQPVPVPVPGPIRRERIAACRTRNVTG